MKKLWSENNFFLELLVLPSFGKKKAVPSSSARALSTPILSLANLIPSPCVHKAFRFIESFIYASLRIWPCRRSGAEKAIWMRS
jgi:hypothetical protein